MAGKYRRLLRGDSRPAELGPLRRKVDRQGRILRELGAEVREAVDALPVLAGQVAPAGTGKPEDPEQWFVTRAELREAVESGEVPQAWTAAPADVPAAADPAAEEPAP